MSTTNSPLDRRRPTPRLCFSALRLAMLSSALSALAGCAADGPMAKLSSINPAVRKQWAADERQATTFYQRSEDLRKLEAGARRLGAEEQAGTAQRLNEMVRQEKNPLLRAQAVRILGVLEHPSAALGLNMAETDSDPHVRQEVCRVRGAQRSRQGLQALARMLANDEDFDVRMSVVRELGGYRDAEAYQALGAALNDPNPALQHRAMVSLRNATGRDLGNDVAGWKQYIATGEVAQPQGGARWASRFTSWF